MIKYKVGRYTANDSMSELICNNYPMLLVMSRFGIDLGVGDLTIDQVCSKSGVDTYTFLAVVNALIAEDGYHIKIDHRQLSLPSLVEYLHNAHSYFLEYRLPSIREKLIDSLDMSSDVSIVITNYYDEYVAEVHKHMMYEEQTLFPYIESVAAGHAGEEYSIEIYSKCHERVEAKLSELKNILIKYYSAKTTYQLNGVLFDIFSCERDLASHNMVEDLLLVPTIKEIERSKN